MRQQPERYDHQRRGSSDGDQNTPRGEPQHCVERAMDEGLKHAVNARAHQAQRPQHEVWLVVRRHIER